MSDEVSSVVGYIEISNVVSSISKPGKSRKSGGGDLRQKLLKSEQVKSLLVVKPWLRCLGLSLPSTAGDVPHQTGHTPRKNIFQYHYLLYSSPLGRCCIPVYLSLR
ncbi:hypothetical protein PILCRDRAFT_715305 [Piloderma croceum F 1598]|uniref:Uncharacterized protein n=1 Tax=Piloderma croceum (strain F 1598) TaxID=765440 RepID=A0A0C3EMY9_PILCF|nr:hypothetical protein PILCRDRAFT_715305 [Piloderma croceum F 1598]